MENYIKKSQEGKFFDSKHSISAPMLPSSFIYEIRQFIKRNSIAVDIFSMHEKKTSYVCCEHCLKAYSVSLAKEMGLSKEIIDFLTESMKGNMGHDGYYLDSDDLSKVE